MTKIDDLKVASDDQLATQSGDMKREQFNLRFQAATGQLEKPSRVRRCAATLRASRRQANAPLPRRRRFNHAGSAVLQGKVVRQDPTRPWSC